MKFVNCVLFPLLFSLISGGSVAANPRPDELYGRLIKIGKQAQSSNNPETATKAFSQAVRLSPQNPHAHLLLAANFLSQGQQRRAEAYLHNQIKRPEQRANARVFMAAIAQLEHRRPFVLSSSFVLKPSSNVNNVSSQEFFDTLLGRFDIDNGADEQFGIGIELGGKVLHRTPIKDGLSIELSGAIYRAIYENNSLRYWLARLEADLKQIGPNEDWRIGIFADRKAFTDVPNSNGELFSYGIRGYLNKRLSPKYQISFNASAVQRDYLNAQTLSGPVFNFETTVRSVHARGRTSFYGLNIERRRTKLDYHQYWGIGVRAGFEYNMSQSLRFGLNGGVTIREYDADFASVNFARQDRIFKVGVSAIHKKIEIFGATPKLSCGYERQKSNIALYSKKTTECQIGWFYRF